MRNLVGLLLLANLGVAAWWHWAVEPETGESPPDRTMRLELVRDVDPAPVPAARETGNRGDTDAASASAMIPAPPAADTRCRQLGPFEDSDAAAAAAALLREQGHGEVTRRALEGEAWTAYWVQLRFDARSDANAALARLETGGVPEAYLIPGDETQVVSLGVFTARARVRRLIERVEALGLAPEVRDRFRDATVHWLELEPAPDEDPDPAMFEPGPGDRLPEWRPCEPSS